MGLKEGDVFGVFGQNSYEYLTLYLGAMIAGAVVYGIASSDTYRKFIQKFFLVNYLFF